MDIFMNFNYKKILRRIKREEIIGNNPIPDILGFLHLKPLYKNKLFGILDKLFEDYETDCKKPVALLKIDVPKSNYTIRPMSRPEIKDWIIYEAIVDLMAKEISEKIKDEHICGRSYSFLNFIPETEKEKNWIKFNNKCRELYALSYKYVVVADLTGYYENINLVELKKRLNNYLDINEKNRKMVKVLIKMLNTWNTGRVKGYGLPQGPPASSFLADLYLDLVDRKMESYENYFRWMDDIRIFCKTEIEAKKALKDLIISLRLIKLNINAKKTKIIKNKEIENDLIDPSKPFLDFIDTVMKSGDKSRVKTILGLLIKIFENSFLGDIFEKTHITFSLYRLRVIKASGIEFDTGKIISLIRENFISKPHHAGLFCSFLAFFHKDETIVDFLISFLKNEHNIYEWQEVRVLQCLLRFNIKFNPYHIHFFIESAKDSNKHFSVRAYYFLLAGKNGSNRDREFIIDLYSSSLSKYLKNAIILAVQELGQTSRNEFYSQVIKNEEDIEIKQFINYVKSLKNPLYYLDREHPRLEILEEEPEYY